jgi:hypothetical protein
MRFYFLKYGLFVAKTGKWILRNFTTATNKTMLTCMQAILVEVMNIPNNIQITRTCVECYLLRKRSEMYNNWENVSAP